MSDKESLRDSYLRKRRTLSNNDVLTWSRLIQRTIIDSGDFSSAASIAFYHPIRQEVHTSLLMQTAWDRKKRVYLPQWRPETRQIHFYAVGPETELIRTAWGTMEPDPQQALDHNPPHIDMILVPGVVFDLKGYRLGYGYGGYDRVLERYRDENSRAWGLAYDMQVIDSLPHEPHDIPCSRIITEQRQIEVL